MALRVPTVDGPAVREAPLQAPLQRSSVSPSMLANPQLEQTGRAMVEIGAQLQERQDADELMRAESEIKAKYLEWEGTAKQRRGQQAWGVAKEAGEFWDKEASKIEGNITSPRAKALFQREVMKNRAMAVGAFSGHEAAERRASLTESAQASIVGSINMAAANPDNIELQQTTKGDIVKRTQMLAQINGWAPEVTEAKQTEFLTNFHKQVLQSLVDRDPKRAKDYFTLNKGEIAGQHHAEIEKVLNVGMRAAKAQEFADGVMASGVDELAALAQARQQFEGEDEKNVVAEIKTRFAERSAARERAQRDAADQAWGIYARTGRFSSIPATTLAALDGQTLASLRKTAQSDAEGRAPKTDMNAYYALSRLADENPEAFVKRDLRVDFPSLSAGDRKHFIDLQARVKSPDERVKEEGFTRQLTTTFRTLGWSGSKDAEKMGAYERAVRDEVRAQETSQKRPLKDTERQAIMDRLLIEGDVNGFWPGGGRRLYEVQGLPEAERFRAEVPKNERAKIEAALQRAGKPVTDEAVRELYLRRHGLQ